LRNGNGAPFGVELPPFGKTEQRAGKSPRQILQNELLDLIACLPHPRAQQFDELHSERRLAVHEGEKVAAVNDENLAIGVRRGAALRGCPSSSEISPNSSPGPAKLRIALRPSEEEILIFTEPLITT
jgi:hypothetical protein